MFLSSSRPVLSDPTALCAPAVDPDALDFVAVDVETACGRVSSICQIGIVGFRGGEIAFEYETLIKTTTVLAVCAEEPFGYVRYDAQFRKAQELQDQGSGIEILSAAALASRCSGF